MKRLTALLMTLMLISTALWADETITVSANSSDISEGLDLKVVAKLFAEAENLEQFEMMLNNPDSAFCNLDLNGDGQVDYLRVVETGEGNKRLIVLQAVLAKDIYQDVASIYVEKDEKDQVSVQVIGDEYVYGTDYIIEPVYVYRPVIYDWFWSDSWYAWHSPWYWGYWPGWWYWHACWAHDAYWHHCYAWHHHHHGCSFRPGRHTHEGYKQLQHGVARRDFAEAHPNRSFSSRNNGMTNAREIRKTATVDSRTGSVQQAQRPVLNANRTYGSTNTVAARTSTSGNVRPVATTNGSVRPTATTTKATTTRPSVSGTTKTRTTTVNGTTRTTSTAQSTKTGTSTRTTVATRTSTSGSTGSTVRSTSSSIRQPQRPTSTATTATTRTSTSSSSGSMRSGSSSTYRGGSSSSSSTFRGGSSSSSSGSVSRGGGSGGGGGRSSGTIRR